LDTDEDGVDGTHIPVKIHKISDSKIQAHEAKSGHWNRERQTFIVTKDRIVANFGLKPLKLMVSGTNFNEIFDKHTHQHPVFGSLNFSFEPDEDQLKHLVTAYNKSAKWLRSAGLGTLPELPLVHEITHLPHKYVGQVKASRALSQDKPTFIRFCPTHKSLQDPAELFYVVMHELAHVVDLNVLQPGSPKLTAAWIRMFERTVEAKTLAQDTVDEIYESLSTAVDFKGFKSSLNEETMEAAKRIFEVIRKTKHVEPYYVAALKDSDSMDTIKALWPKGSACIAAEAKSLVTDYACKNVKELFAEAFSHYAVGRTLPKPVVGLVEASIQRAIKLLPEAIAMASDRSARNVEASASLD
jgi:hypothetical protein